MIQQKLLADIRRNANSTDHKWIYRITKFLFIWMMPIGIFYGYCLFIYVGVPIYYYPISVAGVILYINARKYYIKVSFTDNQPEQLLNKFKYKQFKQNFDEEDIKLNTKQTFTQSDNKILKQEKNTQQRYFCQICKITCPYRTRHCRQCNICTLQFDHHCRWVGNCIGKRNKKQFFFLLLNQFLVSCLGAFFGFDMLQRVSGYIVYTIQPLLRILIAFGLFTAYLIVLNVLLISKGWNYWQYKRKDHISYLEYFNKGYNPFSKGIKGNWMYFLNPNVNENCWQVPTPQKARQLHNQEVDILQNSYYDCCP